MSAERKGEKIYLLVHGWSTESPLRLMPDNALCHSACSIIRKLHDLGIDFNT